MGGTFDPIHWGHLRAAEEVREAFGLDRVLFIPAGTPPHKDPEGITHVDHRLEMARIAIRSNPVFEVWDIEKDREKSYSIETLREIRATFGGVWELYFILGVDAFLEIHTWHEYRGLFELSNWVVLKRAGAKRWGRGALPRSMGDLFSYDPSQRCYVHPSGKRVFFRPFRALEISATEIREMVKGRRSIRYLLPREVEDYIREHNLYT